MRLSFLFWNINNRPLKQKVAQIAVQQDATIVILAESIIDPADMLAEFSSSGLEGFTYPYSPASATSDVQIYLRIPDCELEPVYDDPNSHVSIRRLVFPAFRDLLLVVVHLQSKLHWTGEDQSQNAGRLARKILENESEFDHRRTLLVGDLNMNPFESGVVGSEGLHAVMTKRIAAKRSRVVDAEERHFFYNPMWRLFGERNDGPPGTHFFAGSGKPINFFWNMFDQVLVRPSLIEALGEVKILDRAGAVSLLTDDGTPDRSVGSDHFPIFFALNLVS